MLIQISHVPVSYSGCWRLTLWVLIGALGVRFILLLGLGGNDVVKHRHRFICSGILRQGLQLQWVVAVLGLY